MLVYNTLTRRKEPFQPKSAGLVNIYVCGITAYDLCHIGHARSAVVFDVLVRYLRSLGLEVNFIRNFTDVDDKIIRRANELGTSSRSVADTYIKAFHEDMDRLSVLRADHEPRCTEYIPPMIEMTERLIAGNHAYPADGDVYFRVRSLEEYGALSNRDPDSMRAGARIAPGEQKEDPLDFALWKAAKPGEPSWDSPWGPGRPGWHLECSVMAEALSVLPLDIHGGGQDLVFPHHENEIAQTKAATGIDLARYWMHNGFVNINAEKMSKSLGNFLTIRDILQNYHPEVLRFFLLSAHYRKPLDFSTEAMEEAEKGLRRIYSALKSIRTALERSSWTKAALDGDILTQSREMVASWDQAMDDDLNTAAALGHVFSLLRLSGQVMENSSQRKSQGARDLLRSVLDAMQNWGGVLGLFSRSPSELLLELRSLRARRRGIDPEVVTGLLEERARARLNKEFTEADALRTRLLELNVHVMDTPHGQEWDVE